MNPHVRDLKQKGIFPSYQRVRILEFVRSCVAADFFCQKEIPLPFRAGSKRDYHPTVEQIHACLVKEIPTLSRTTVYNALRLFEEKNLLSSVMIVQQGSHGVLRYDRCAEPHAHLLCNTCQELLDWPIHKALHEHLGDVTRKDSDSKSWQLILRGNCPDCRFKHIA